MNLIKDILKGALIGVANIIPGVSGGTMAVSMGVYDRIISAITGIRSNFKKSLSTLFPIILGAVIGIVLLSFIITPLFEYYPIPTATAFSGLIIGGLPSLVKKVKGQGISPIYIILFLLFFAAVVYMSFMNEDTTGATDIAVNFTTGVQLFFIGVVASATMIIPGVSGSLVLMILGFYNIIISNISAFIKALLHVDAIGILHGIGIFVPFGIGVLIGIGVIAKIIEWLFNKHPNPTYYAIIGLTCASPIAVIYKIGIDKISPIIIVVSVVTFIVGCAISFVLGKDE